MTKTNGASARPGARARTWAKPAVAPELPPGLPARLLAAAVLADVAGSGHSLDEALGSEGVQAKLQALDPRDRALVRSIAVVSLRRLGTIRRALARLLERGLPKKAGALEWTLVVAAAQVLFLDIPDHAAVNACVQAVRLDPKTLPFAALANAVARNLARQKDELLADLDPFVDTPAWLAARWKQTWGEERAARIAAAHRTEPSLDLTVKADAPRWAATLEGTALANGSVRLSSSNVPVPELTGYVDGEWWVQDAAASLPARLLRVEAGQRVADLCAAPGGKTAQLALAGAHVVAVDRSAERLKRLAANLQRLGLAADTQVADITTFSADPFDAILLDAPCSATGTVRRHPDVAWTKRASDITALAAIQTKMLDRALTLLRPGGTLVYCVCSLEPEEGEAQVAALLRRNPDVARVPVEAHEVAGWGEVVTAAGDLRTLPSMAVSADPPLDGLDGFFASRLVRKA